jgi:hypothetical protein
MTVRRWHILNIAILGFVTAWVFRGYLIGQKSPSWDFITSYFTASYVWWNNGSFFAPPNYLPYAFSGFPAHLSAQASSWYLPVGLLAELKIYNLHSASILQVITIFVGVIGFYFLALAWNLPKSISLIVALSFLFTPGFFSSASHVDIVRGWAFVPWVLLFLKPISNTTWWKPILIALISFQFMIGVYPGIIISTFYILIFYVGLNLYYDKNLRSNYFVYQVLPFGLGVGLSLIKWIPLLIADRIDRGGNSVEINSAIISTIIYPFDTSVLPPEFFNILLNDITMRSLFIMPIILLLILLLQRIDRLVVTFLVISTVAIILGIDLFTTNQWQESLPLLGESRFRTIDFKLFWTLGALMLGGRALQQAKETKISYLRGGVALLIAFSFLWLLNYFAKTALINEMLVSGNQLAKFSAAAFTSIVFLLILQKWLNFAYPLAVAITIFSVLVSGYLWISANKATWLHDRSEVENYYYGSSVEELILQGLQADTDIRPSRIGPRFPIPYPSELAIFVWSSTEITNRFSLGGYVPLKGISRYEESINLARNARGVPYFRLLAKPQSGWVVDRDIANLETVKCIYRQSCLVEDYLVEPTKWKIDELSFSVASSDEGLLVVNEIPWEGWQAEVCSENSCTKVKTEADLETLLLSVPISPDTTSVTFFYQQPYKQTSWIIFWLSLVGVLILSVRIKKKVV